VWLELPIGLCKESVTSTIGHCLIPKTLSCCFQNCNRIFLSIWHLLTELDADYTIVVKCQCLDSMLLTFLPGVGGATHRLVQGQGHLEKRAMSCFAHNLNLITGRIIHVAYIDTNTKLATDYIFAVKNPSLLAHIFSKFLPTRCGWSCPSGCTKKRLTSPTGHCLIT
jgi:hypothetical protein